MAGQQAMNEQMIELLNRLISEDKNIQQPYVKDDTLFINSPYQNEILNQVLSNIRVAPQHSGEKGMRPEDALYFYNKNKKMAQEQIERKYVGESKSIDDIINSANIAESLSEAMSDRTNVESTNKEIKQLLPGRRDIDMFMQAMFPDVYEQHQRSMLEKKLIDLAKEKPTKG